MRLKDKVALITGGGTGIGQGIAKASAAEGAHVAVCGRRVEPLEETVEQITSSGGKAFFLTGDVAVEEDATRIVSETIAHCGRLDILVNNAGTNRRTTLADAPVEDWNLVMDVNVGGTFLVSRVAIPQMITQGSGAIVNITSIAGIRGQMNLTSYSAAKGAVRNMTRAMAADYGQHGIRVNAVAPGLVRTSLSETRVQPGQTWEELAEELWIPKIPMGRTGTPEDIAKAVVFLSSEDASWITGAELVVDGGQLAPL